MPFASSKLFSDLRAGLLDQFMWLYIQNVMHGSLTSTLRDKEKLFLQHP